MKLSSRLTWIFPFVFLLLAAYFISGYFYFFLYPDYQTYQILKYLLPFPVAVGLYFGLKKLAPKVNLRHLKLALFIPGVLLFLLAFSRIYAFLYFAALGYFGILMSVAILFFERRYTATLTDTSIQYENLLGQKGEIPLTAITGLEQKLNILSFLNRYVQILDLTRKTCITFHNENYDEYEIKLYARLFKHKVIFENIINNANKAGNLKIRQYSF